MKLAVVRKSPDRLVATPIVQQTAFWGRVQRQLGIGVEAFDVRVDDRASAASSSSLLTAAGEGAAGDFLVMRTPLTDEIDCAYVPFGPELTPEAGAVGGFLERLSRALAPMLGPRCAFVRWDLPWTSVHAREADDFTADGAWRGPPAPHLRELRMNFGTDERNLYKAPRDLLPSDTILVDVDAADDELLARMHPKTRYNLRLAARHGVVVSEGTVEELPAWYALYLETMARNHLEPLPLGHFVALLTERGEGSTSPVEPRLLVARHEGALIAGALIAVAPPRATYLYGASSRARRDVMAPYALQWAAIRLARAHGCRDYDLFGAAPRGDAQHSLAGVHRFKVGFGGRLVHREGCWDFPLDDTSYAAVRRWEESHVLHRAVAPAR